MFAVLFARAGEGDALPTAVPQRAEAAVPCGRPAHRAAPYRGLCQGARTPGDSYPRLLSGPRNDRLCAGDDRQLQRQHQIPSGSYLGIGPVPLVFLDPDQKRFRIQKEDKNLRNNPPYPSFNPLFVVNSFLVIFYAKLLKSCFCACSGVCSPWYSWWYLPLQGPDPGWQPRCLLCYERRCLCRLSPGGEVLIDGLKIKVLLMDYPLFINNFSSSLTGLYLIISKRTLPPPPFTSGIVLFPLYGKEWYSKCSDTVMCNCACGKKSKNYTWHILFTFQTINEKKVCNVPFLLMYSTKKAQEATLLPFLLRFVFPPFSFFLLSFPHPFHVRAACIYLTDFNFK